MSFQYHNGVLEKFLCDPDKRDLDIELPEGITEIADGAFENCKSVKTVTLPSSLRRIGAYAFRGCTNLTICKAFSSSLDHPEPLGEGAFSGCSSLARSILNPCAPVTKIPKDCFSKCTCMIEFYFPDGLEDIESGAFSGCSRPEKLVIPEGVKKIGNGAFSRCSGLTSISIPKGLTEIPWGCFTGCRKLTEVTIPNGIKKICPLAFAGCSELAVVSIPESVEEIEVGVFNDCPKFFRVFMDSWKAKIGSGNFDHRAMTEFCVGQASPYSVNPILVYLTEKEGCQHFYKNCYIGQQLFLEIQKIDCKEVIAVYTYFNLHRCYLGYLPQDLADVMILAMTGRKKSKTFFDTPITVYSYDYHKYLCYVHAKTLDMQRNYGLRLEVSELDPAVGGLHVYQSDEMYFDYTPEATDLLDFQPPRRTDLREIK